MSGSIRIKKKHTAGPSTPADEIHERLSAQLLSFRKNVGLYPNDHPLLLKAAKTVQEEVRLYADLSGAPFTVDSSLCAEDAAPATAASEGDNLAKLLRRNLIRKLTIRPGVSTDELFDFLRLVHRGVAAQPEGEGQDAPRYAAWMHISIDVYEQDDLTDILPPADEVTAALAAGLPEQLIEAWLSGVPPALREPLRQKVIEPAFLAKLLRLRDSIAEAQKSSQGEEQRGVDLIREVLRTASEAALPGGATQQTAEQISENVSRLVDFLASNQQVLEGSTRAYSDAGQTSFLVRRLQESFESRAGGSGYGAVELQRARLSFLFQTQAGPAASPPPTTEAPLAQTVRPEHALETHTGRSRDSDTRFLQRFAATTYNVEEMGRALRLVPWKDRYLLTVLELLSSKKHREFIEPRIGAIVKTLLSMPAGNDSLKSSMARITAFLLENWVPEVEALLVELLRQFENVQEAAQCLDEVVRPNLSADRLHCLFGRLSKASPRKAVAVLALLLQSGGPPGTDMALEHLRVLATDPVLAALWVQWDPVCFTRPRVSKVLRGHSPREIREAFHEYMAHQEPAEVSMLLTSIPPGTAGGEHLIFTALERGPAEIRVCAIEQFGKFPTPEVINALIDIVNLNNNHPEPVLAEVEAACLALARMQVEAATAFVDRVIRARSGLLHVYRKPIRKAMARMAAQERKS